MKKIIVEVGSTCTKVDLYNGQELKKLKGKTIWFKKNYQEDGKLRDSDIVTLIDSINELKDISDNIYVCGTSIFRDISATEKEDFIKRFKEETGYDFHIINQDNENELTVQGVASNLNKKVCVLVAGGGSTEISIYDKGIVENVNTKMGVIDVMQKFPDLADDIATSDLEEVKAFIKSKLHLPQSKTDILILAGGAHEYFARESGVTYQNNTLYDDPNEQIMMDIETRKKDTERYFKEISLDAIRSRVDDPNWWFATRAMCALVLVIAEAIDAKYIVPTDIAMAYGIAKEE